MLAGTLPRPSRRALIVILAVAAALRTVWVLYAARWPIDGEHDPVIYLNAAEELARGHGYRFLDGQTTTYYPVGYPALLSTVVWLVRHTPIPDHIPRAAGFLNVGLGLVGIVLLYHLVRRLVGEREALTAAALMAVFPNLVFHSAAILSETLFITLVLAAVLIACWEPLPSITAGRLAATGAMLGVAALVRPPALLIPIALLIGLRASGLAWRKAAVSVGVVLAVAALVLVPWSVRNLLVTGEPVLISTNIGDDFCFGHNPQAEGSWQRSRYCTEGHAPGPRPEYEVRRNRDNLMRGLTYAVSHPLEEAELLVKRVFWLFYHDTDGLEAGDNYDEAPLLDRYPVRRRMVEGGANAFFFGVFVLAAVGLRPFLHGRDPRRLTFVISAGVLLVPPLLFFADARFHVPAVPALVTLAAVVIRSRIGPVVAVQPSAPEARRAAMSESA